MYTNANVYICISDLTVPMAKYAELTSGI